MKKNRNDKTVTHSTAKNVKAHALLDLSLRRLVRERRDTHDCTGRKSAVCPGGKPGAALSVINKQILRHRDSRLMRFLPLVSVGSLVAVMHNLQMWLFFFKIGVIVQ